MAPALYFSRAPVPSGEGPLWHHIGIYAFRRAALARFVALPESPLERRESAGTVARAGGGHAHRLRAGGPCAVRRGHARRPRARPARTRSGNSEHCMTAVHRLPGPARRLFRPGLPHRLSAAGARCPARASRRPSRRCARARPGSPCCRARTAWPAGCRTSTLLPGSGLFVVGEHFQRVEHCLLAPKGAAIGGAEAGAFARRGAGPGAAAARELGCSRWCRPTPRARPSWWRQWDNPEDCAIASSLAAEIFGLDDAAAQRRGRGAQHHALLHRRRAAAADPPRRTRPG